MIEWLEVHIADILSIIVAISGCLTSVFTLVRSLKLGKGVNTQIDKLKEDVEVTREGIVQAFTKAQFPTQWKVDLSTQVNNVLVRYLNELTLTITEREGENLRLMQYIAYILKNTTSYNKLTDEEKVELDALLQKINTVELDGSDIKE